ncbi:MAG: hypothetical protein VCA74_03175 [Deltaproteobacteria bacterium]
MDETRTNSTTLMGSLRSLMEIISSLEGELESVLKRANLRMPSMDLASLLGVLGGVFGGVFKTGWGSGIPGLGSGANLEQLRDEVCEAMEEVSRLREREVVMAGGLSHLRSRAGRFEEALEGLARVQGRCLSRMETSRVATNDSARSEVNGVLDGVRQRLEDVEKRFKELKSLQRSGSHGMIEGLEGIRERVVKLESRSYDMSRESQAKSGRLDALTRHVASVESRLASAIGSGSRKSGPVVSVGTDSKRPVHIGGAQS